jgi:DNA-binding HxlR family transcriptional regulator
VLNKCLYILIYLITLSSSLFSFDIYKELEEYQKIQQIDISPYITNNKGSDEDKFTIIPLVEQIDKIYSKKIYYTNYSIDINDTNNIFFKAHPSESEQIMKDDFHYLLKQYMKTSQLFTVKNSILISEKNQTGIMQRYKIIEFFDFLSAYIYYLKANEKTIQSNLILNRLTIDLNNAMKESNFVDFLISLIIYNILHENNICSYSKNTVFNHKNLNLLKNQLFQKLHNEIPISIYTINSMLKSVNSKGLYHKEVTIHTLKMTKYYLTKLIKILKSNNQQQLKQFEKKFHKKLNTNSEEVASTILYKNKQYTIHTMSKTIPYIVIPKIVNNYKKAIEKLDYTVKQFAICSQY